MQGLENVFRWYGIALGVEEDVRTCFWRGDGVTFLLCFLCRRNALPEVSSSHSVEADPSCLW